MEHRSLLVVYVFNFYQTPRVVPHGTKGTGPRFVTRPVYLRSQFRNNLNTVSVLVPVIHLWRVHYRFFVHSARVSHITGRTRPPGEVGLTPRQYTEWNVLGACSLYWRSLSVGAAACSVPYCQYREVCSPTRPSTNKPTNYQQRTNSRPCARVVYIAGDTLHHQPMGAGHMTVLQFRGPMAFHVLQWCHPMLANHEGGQAVVPGWSPYMVLESGFSPTHFPPLLSWSATIVGGLQIILQPFFGLNPKIIGLNTI